MADETTTTPKRRHGCLFYGCIAGSVCLVAILIAVLVGIHMFKKVIAQYTDTKPMPLPALQMTPDQIQAVRQRYETFRDAVSAGRPTPPLTLNSDEVNALIAGDPNFSALKGKAYVKIEDSHLNAQLSVPMDQIGLSMFKGRYLNGAGTFAVSLTNGLLDIYPREISVKGKPLPETYMEKLRTQNLAQGINDNPQSSVGLNRLQQIQITNGTMLLVPKQEK